jgi:hypothetical protein
LQIENGEEELQFQNPKSCSFCGNWLFGLTKMILFF